jgi:hypothetical protein
LDNYNIVDNTYILKMNGYSKDQQYLYGKIQERMHTVVSEKSEAG